VWVWHARCFVLARASATLSGWPGVDTGVVSGDHRCGAGHARRHGPGTQRLRGELTQSFAVFIRLVALFVVMNNDAALFAPTGMAASTWLWQRGEPQDVETVLPWLPRARLVPHRRS
jgi:hypothetical protein